jgi:hypothetical protein
MMLKEPQSRSARSDAQAQQYNTRRSEPELVHKVAKAKIAGEHDARFVPGDRNQEIIAVSRDDFGRICHIVPNLTKPADHSGIDILIGKDIHAL